MAGDIVRTQITNNTMPLTEYSANDVTTQGFSDIADTSQPGVKTLDPTILKIGEQLQTEVSPILPNNPLVTSLDVQKAQDADNSKQVQWLIFGLILSFSIQYFFFKRGKK